MNFKSVLLLLIGFYFIGFNSAAAKKDDLPTDALYIVPTSAEWFSHSRFKIKIIKPYQNEQTQVIAYEFPEVLVGEPQRTIEFSRIPQTINSWQSVEGVKAMCNVTDEVFNCNIEMNSVLQSEFSLDKALNHLNTLNLSQEDLVGYSEVVKSFFGNEPAGILSYDL